MDSLSEFSSFVFYFGHTYTGLNSNLFISTKIDSSTLTPLRTSETFYQTIGNILKDTNYKETSTYEEHLLRSKDFGVDLRPNFPGSSHQASCKFPVPINTVIYSNVTGVVEITNKSVINGALYIRDKNGYQHRYLHMRFDNPLFSFRHGDIVYKGQPIGFMADVYSTPGSSIWPYKFCHLHFSVWGPDGLSRNPHHLRFDRFSGEVVEDDFNDLNNWETIDHTK